MEAVRTVGIDVSGSTMWFGDERCVPPDDERSNYGMAKASMFDRLGADALPTIHRMKGELGPDAGAEDYEGQLREAGSPRFDLVLLGIGPDGHCASLFPDQSSLSERSRVVVGVEQAGLEPFVPRVTHDAARAARARQIVFLATGESKAEPLAAAFGPRGQARSRTCPSSLAGAAGREIKVLLDPAAAAGLGSAASGAA